MNKRIRELAEQAGIDFFSSTDPEYSGRQYCEAWTEQQQKFAELIVKECARVYWNIDDGEIHSEYVNALKQHFGVEE